MRKQDSQRKLGETNEEIKFEFMSLGTPKQNGVIKQVFATLYSQMRMVMAHMRLHENPNISIWTKCALTATKPENIMVNPHEEKCAYKKFYGKTP